jgi:hypothetical protein
MFENVQDKISNIEKYLIYFPLSINIGLLNKGH